ncbi:tetratricopeptide repeat protein [uncultured Thiohalocapsa sp.]|uniref:tetratricopeptide repeat protein n=1 Tax=uncultured Thiohalocapsa sp. TaxID=768990 RepID=UPI0025F5DEA3|nr:tetratricopeptide repeat protein [uncultured Thiohalocapsa sp.]
MTRHAHSAALWLALMPGLMLGLMLALTLPALAVADDLPEPAADTQDTTANAAAGAEAGAPPSELTADLIYSVLVGEVAAQRADQRMAFTHYLHAAQLARDPELAALAARAALALGDPQAGQRAVDLWQGLDPDSVKARQIAAYVQIEAGDRDATLAALRELVRVTPAGRQPYLQAAQLLARIEDPAERLDLMQALIADAADDADAQFALATLAVAADDNALARKAAARAAELRPDWNEPRIFLVQLLVADGEREAAAGLLDDYLAQAGDDKALTLLRAQLHIDAEEYASALEVFDAVLARDPDQPDVLFTAAVLALEVDALDKARTHLTRLDELGRREDDVAFLFGQLEERAGNADAALGWYARVDGSNATDAAVRIARLHAAGGDVSRARDMLQQLRDQMPDDAVTLYLIEGEMLREHDAEQQAMAVYDQAVAARPDDPDLRYARAMVAVGLDRVELLESDLRHILAQDPEHADALNALGYTLADRTDRLAEAKELIEQALALKPDEPAIMDSMGWVLYRMGDPQAAEPYLRQALDLVFDPEIAAHLGEVLWALGRKDEARAIWDRALEADPEHEYLLRVLGKHRYSQTPGN